MQEQKNKNSLDITLLLIAAVCPYFLGVIGVGISLILLIIYFLNMKKKYFIKTLLLLIWFISAVSAIGGLFLISNMTNTGIDSIGEALLYGAIIKLGSIAIIAIPFLLLIIDNWKNLFTKKNIIIIIILGIAILLCIHIKELITTTKVSDNIPTVTDFENELNNRGFKTNTEDYRLYGINGKENKAINLSFSNNGNDKYPLYIYSVVDYSWIIYYANGNIYAVRGKYWDDYSMHSDDSDYNEEKIIWDYGSSANIISETEEIYAYDPKLNRYRKGKTLSYSDYNVHSENAKISIYLDIPIIDSKGTEIKKIDRLDYNSLYSLKRSDDYMRYGHY